MSRAAAFFRWLGSPIRAVRGLFPFTHEGRQTLVYLVFAGAGPALTLVVLDVLSTTSSAKQWGIYENVASKIGWALLIITTALGCFTAFRAVSLGKDGLKAESKDDDAPPTAVAVAVATAEASSVPEDPGRVA